LPVCSGLESTMITWPFLSESTILLTSSHFAPVIEDGLELLHPSMIREFALNSFISSMTLSYERIGGKTWPSPFASPLFATNYQMLRDPSVDAVSNFDPSNGHFSMATIGWECFLSLWQNLSVLKSSYSKSSFFT